MALTKAFAVFAGQDASSGSITTGSFNSTGYTHVVVFVKHEGAATTITPSDNKSSTGWSKLTYEAHTNGDLNGQLMWAAIGSPGTGHTITATFGAARAYSRVGVWLVNSGGGGLALDSGTDITAEGGLTAIDVGSITTSAAAVLFMAVGEYSAVSFTPGTGWTEDWDPNGTGGFYGFGQSRNEASSGTFDPACTQSANASWVGCAAAFIETTTGTSITTGLGALTLTGLVPTVSATGGGNVSVSSGLGQAVITGLAPTAVATGNQFATSGLGQAVITGLAPTVVATDNVRITAALGQAVITGFAPSQTLTLGAPGVGQLVLSGHAPTVQVSAPGAITTGLGALVFTGFAPSVNAADSASITAGVGSLVATGFAPTVSATANVSIASALGQAVITGLAPTLAATDNQFATPDVGQAVITGYAPALSQAGSFSAAPGVGILELLGLSPSVVNSGDVTTSRRHAGYIWPRRRNYIYKGKRYHNLTPDELMRLIAADEADITREDIKVSYKNKKPHIIAKDAWADLQTALQSLSKLEAIEYDDDEDIEAIIALL